MKKNKMIKTIGSVIAVAAALSFVPSGHLFQQAAFSLPGLDDSTGAVFAESKTYEPSQKEIEAIMNADKDPSVSESKKQQETENPEEAVIKVKKEIDGKLVISWSSDAELFHVVLTNSSGNTVLAESTENKSITVKDLNPGETYTFSIVSETNGTQSDEIKKEIKTSPETDWKIVNNEAEAVNMVSSAINDRKSTCTFFMKKELNVNVENIMDSAFRKIPDGQYVKNNVSVFFESADAKNYGDFKEDYSINGVRYTKFSFGFSYLTTKKQHEEFEKELVKVEEELGLKGDITDKYKVLSIIRYVQENVTDTTDVTGLNNTAYGALINKKATCNGRAALVYRLLNSAGIRNSIVTGEFHDSGTEKAKTEESAAMQHSINTVVLNGKPVALDTLDSGCAGKLAFLGF